MGCHSVSAVCQVINAITTFIACCLCFKRRDDDVLPPEFTKAGTSGWIDEAARAGKAKKTPYLVDTMFTI